MPAGLDAVIASIPRNPQQTERDTSHGSDARPAVWVARIKGRWHYYGKNCCLAWQPPEVANLTGIIAEYDWHAMHSNIHARMPVPRPLRENDNQGCWLESDTTTNYSEGAFPPQTDVFDPAGFAALNMAEFTYKSEGDLGGLDRNTGLRRIDYDNAGYPPTGGRAYAYVVMSFGLFRDRLIPTCPNEPRKDRRVPFFSRYFIGNLEPCVT